MGLRMTDMFGHINNSRYIEAMEFARWHQMSCTGMYGRMKRGKLFPVVSSLDLQFVREIKPCSTVVIRTQMGTPIGKSAVFYQQIESVKGDVIHATGIIRFAWLNESSYRHEDGSVPKAGPVPAEEGLLRMGWSRKEVNDCVSGAALSHANAQYFGKKISSYDTIRSDTSLGTKDQTSLTTTFDATNLKAINEADSVWRKVLREELKHRKDVLSK
eukprot:GDKJ01002138.1.p1 GENE.GDKJ01002138.1~~GDKJ01002138.1.p1  ORF type:complete len:227 (+),score=-2.70 GDKJ01002138.1:37-681(+)